jgi:hypothetical protein
MVATAGASVSSVGLVCPRLNAGAWAIEDLRHACGSTPKTGDAGIMHRIGLPAGRDTGVDQRG